MEPPTTTYTKTFLDQRDRVILEKHKKELEIRDRKNERLKRANDETLKQLHEAQHRGDRLARSLGFNDMFEAQITIDTADDETSYKECLERVEALQQELFAVQADNERFQALIETLEDERERLQAELSATEKRVNEHEANASKHRSTLDRRLQELKQLQERYDALADVKERAADRYKVDYAKWRRFKNWIFTEEAEHAKDKKEAGISEEEKRNRYMASIMRKKKMMLEIGFDPEGDDSKTPTPISRPPPLGGITNLECDKENLSTPMAEKKTRRSSTPASSSRMGTLSSTAVPASDTTLPGGSNNKSHAATALSLRNRFINTVAQATTPSSSPTLFNNPSSSNTTRVALTFHPIIPQKSPSIKQEAGSPSSIPTSHRPPKRQRSSTGAKPPSSDTEEDSQIVGNNAPHIGPYKVPASPATSPAHMPSSQTQADSQSQFYVFPDPTPCPPRPMQTTKPLSHPAHPSLPARPAFTQPRRVVSRDAESLQPTKMRRLSDQHEHVPSSTLESSTPKPKNLPRNGGPSTKKGKGQEIQASVSTPASLVRTSGQKRLEDYSVFKGRGRYAKETTTAKESINAQFEIDPQTNKGLDFQYDEVVRGREDRRRMDAGDCECCRDYYEAVGPLPNRLQAPLWRSPPTTPAKPCTRHQQHLSVSGSKSTSNHTSDRQSEINSHRQAISRHRHHWERAKTPPGYWEIGFPDTQEAEDINERAREMHRKKREEIEAAARRENGRYRRRS